jgi:mannose-6-phosphate isomerase-like protein (cupin superfamily)
MSYPDPKYLGEGGEVSAVLRPANRPADLQVGMSEASYLIKGEATGGKFGLYRWDMAPGTPGAAAHFHRTLSESFFILSGVVGLYNGDKWVDATAGDYLYVPEGGIHGFRNASQEPASMLILFSPGAPREPYFEGLADVALGRRKFTPEEYKAFCQAHDNIFVP